MTQDNLDRLMAVVDERLRLLGCGFGVEVVLAFPLVTRVLGEPVLASAGLRDRVAVEPARVFRHAIRCGASGVVLGHNHPADTGPSEADLATTRRLVAAGQVLGVPLVAHVVAEPGRVHELVSGRNWTRELARTPEFEPG